MGKIFHVEHISSCEKEIERLYKTKNLVQISEMPGNPGLSLLSGQYSTLFESIRLENKTTSEIHFSNLYIESDGDYFQVSNVCATTEESNAICLKRDDVGIIATDNEGRHYLASLKPVSIFKSSVTA